MKAQSKKFFPVISEAYIESSGTSAMSFSAKIANCYKPGSKYATGLGSTYLCAVHLSCIERSRKLMQPQRLKFARKPFAFFQKCFELYYFKCCNYLFFKQSKMTKQCIKTNNLALLSFKKVDIAQKVLLRVLT